MSERRRLNLLWIQSGGCGGCTLSLLGAESPDLLTTLDSAGIDLLWHPIFSEESSVNFLDLLDTIVKGEIRLDILCLEGAVVCGPNGTGRFHHLVASGESMMSWIVRLAEVAKTTVAIGSCAAYGGMTAAGDNPSEASGLQYQGREAGGVLGREYRSASGLPVVNVSGCPPHPNWMSETLLEIASEGVLSESDLDDWGRPRSFADHLVHHGCPRNEYYEYKASAQKPSDLGCLMEQLGCLGTQAHADCNIRLWNGEGSCLRGGFACINCTAPGFEEPSHPFSETPKVAGIPVGLPTDMPKAWFVALASLSKAATPKRLKENAVTDHIRIPPSSHKRGRE